MNLGNIVDQSCRNEKNLALRNIKGVLCDDYKAGTWRFRLQVRRLVEIAIEHTRTKIFASCLILSNSESELVSALVEHVE